MRLRTVVLIAAFAATVPAANWMIGNIGTECIPDGPCLLPTGFGTYAPSGVLMVGAALVLRDMVQEVGGIRAALLAIGIGGALSWVVAPPALVLASVTAFLLAELADLAVYTPLRKRRLGLAVVASGAVGSIVDSAVFLLIAFGTLQFVEGQILGKLWMSIAAMPFIVFARRAREGGNADG